MADVTEDYYYADPSLCPGYTENATTGQSNHIYSFQLDILTGPTFQFTFSQSSQMTKVRTIYTQLYATVSLFSTQLYTEIQLDSNSLLNNILKTYYKHHIET